MKVSEAIDQLKVGDTVWVRGVVGVVYQGLHPSINIREAGWFSKNTEISLAEPKNEKVEVPDYIAKLIRKYKAKKETLFCSIANLYRESDEYKWYVDNAEIYERAWVNGYTVKPKRWVVKFRNEETDFYYMGWSDIYKTDDNPFVPNGYMEKNEDCVFRFTDHAKAEAVATLVEGTVEEV